MKKALLGKWLLLGFLLLAGLSALSVMAYRKAHAVNSFAGESCERPAGLPGTGELLLDAVSRQFTSCSATQ